MSSRALKKFGDISFKALKAKNRKYEGIYKVNIFQFVYIIMMKVFVKNNRSRKDNGVLIIFSDVQIMDFYAS